MTQSCLDDYLMCCAESGIIGDVAHKDPFTWTEFSGVYLKVLSNQSSYFREIYAGMKPCDIDIQKSLADVTKNVRECFTIYDKDGSGWLSHEEAENLLKDMDLHR